jgi:hypothetical protein
MPQIAVNRNLHGHMRDDDFAKLDKVKNKLYGPINVQLLVEKSAPRLANEIRDENIVSKTVVKQMQSRINGLLNYQE